MLEHYNTFEFLRLIASQLGMTKSTINDVLK